MPPSGSRSASPTLFACNIATRCAKWSAVSCARAWEKKKATGHIGKWTTEHIPAQDREQFRATAEGELLGLHEGNFARYQIRPSEFEAW